MQMHTGDGRVKGKPMKHNQLTIGKSLTLLLLSSTTTSAPDTRSSPCCSRAARIASREGKRYFPFLQPPCSVGQGLVDIFTFKIRVGCQNLFGSSPGCQQTHDRSSRHPQPPNACFASHHGRVESNSWKRFHLLPFIVSHTLQGQPDCSYDSRGLQLRPWKRLAHKVPDFLASDENVYSVLHRASG